MYNKSYNVTISELRSVAHFICQLLAIFTNNRLKPHQIENFNDILLFALKKYFKNIINTELGYIIIGTDLSEILTKCAIFSDIEIQYLEELFCQGKHIFVWIDSKRILNETNYIKTLWTLYKNDTGNPTKIVNIKNLNKLELPNYPTDYWVNPINSLMKTMKGQNKVIYGTFEMFYDKIYYNIDHIKCQNSHCFQRGITIISTQLPPNCNNFIEASKQLDPLRKNPSTCDNLAIIEQNARHKFSRI